MSPGRLPRYREFLERNRYGRKLLDYDGKANRPMVQAFYTEAAQNIFSLSGFVDRTGELFVARGAVKVLQRPRKLGIGLCFEEVPVDPELAEKVRAHQLADSKWHGDDGEEPHCGDREEAPCIDG